MRAREFYARHGVTSIESAAESGLDLAGKRVMTTKYCIKHQMGWCKTYPNPKARPVRAARRAAGSGG